MRYAAAAIIVVLCAAAAGLAWAQTGYWSDDKDYLGDYPKSHALCRAVQNLKPPMSDRPDGATSKGLKGCSSERLYYGVGIPADPAKARQCAFLEADQTDDGGAFSGSAMLMTIYANGRGAHRDLDLAMHYACGIDGAPAEYDGRVTHLAALKTNPSAKPFDYCDDVTSGLAGGFCASHTAKVHKAVRDAQLTKLMAGWSPSQRAAFAPLNKAYEAYVAAHSSKEVDMSGTLRGAFSIDAEESVRDDFLEKLTTLSAGAVPDLDYKDQDAQLNEAYRVQMRTPEEQLGTVKHTDIRTTQRIWLAYRDAFVLFAKVLSPSTSSDAIAAWVTQRRVKWLTEGDGEEG
jgi:hypothetical protein